MSTRFKDIRNALWAAVRAADTDVKDKNIHKRIRNPKDTTPDAAKALMGFDDGKGNTYLRGYFISRIASPESSEEADDGGDTIFNTRDQWRIRALWSFSDEDETREESLQETLDDIRASIWTNSDVSDLVDSWNTKVDSVSIDAILLDLIHGRDLVFNVLITVSFRIDAIQR